MAQDPNAGPAIPPGLESLLQGAGAAGGGGEESQDSSPDASSDSYSGGGDDFLSCLQKMVDDAKKCIDLAPDQQSKQRVAKLLVAIQAELATDEKQKDDMLQGKMSPASMRGAIGGA